MERASRIDCMAVSGVIIEVNPFDTNSIKMDSGKIVASLRL